MPKLVLATLDEAVFAFLDSVMHTARYFGMGGDVPIPSSADLDLLRALESFEPKCHEDLSCIASKMTLRQADLLGAFAVRMATLAVRTQQAEVLRLGAFALVMDNDLVDYRAMLMTLSVIEDAALRLKIDLASAISNAASVATARRRELIDEYLSSLPAFRGIAVMGIEAVGNGVDFRYKAMPWTT